MRGQSNVRNKLRVGGSGQSVEADRWQRRHLTTRTLAPGVAVSILFVAGGCNETFSPTIPPEPMDASAPSTDESSESAESAGEPPPRVKPAIDAGRPPMGKPGLADARAPSKPPGDASSGRDAADGSLELADGGLPGSVDATTKPGAPEQPCTALAYVSNSYSDNVSVIDTNTHEVVATVPTGKAPINPTFTPDRRKVYVANSQAETLTVIDVGTNTATTIPAGGKSPSGLAFSPDGETLWVSYIGENFVAPGSVTSLELETGTAAPPIPMGADPERIALTPDGKRLFVNNLLDGTMAVVDTEQRKVIKTVMLGALPFNPLMSPDGTVVYVGVMSENHIAVVDTTTFEVKRKIAANSPNGMTFSLDYQSLYVSNALSGTVQEVSLSMSSVLKSASVGGVPGNMAVLPDGKHAYMVRPDGTTVEVLDTSNLKIVDTITAGSGPTVVTVCRPPAPVAP